MFLCLYCHLRPKETVLRNILLRLKWPISSWYPLRAVSQCTAGKTNWNRAFWDSFGRIFLYRMPYLRLRWLCSQRRCWRSGGSVSLNGHWLRIPFCILTITRPRTGSAHWVWCWLLVVMQVPCGPSPTGSQVTAVCINRTHGVFEGTLLHSSHCHCSDLVVCAQSIGHTSRPGHPQQSIHINVHFPCSIVQLKIIIGKAGLLTMTHCLTYCWYRCQRLIHKDTYEISWPWPT